MRLARIIEFCFAFLVAFVLLSFVSFLSLRPVLDQGLAEARADWSAFLRAVSERNESIPGLVQALRGFEPGHGRLTQKMLEARSISVRTTESDAIVAAVDDTDRFLAQVEKLLQARPQLEQYPPFAAQWKKTVSMTQRISYLRRSHSSSVRSYNRLLKAFPQNLLTTLFGFVPLHEYPVPVGSTLQ